MSDIVRIGRTPLPGEATMQMVREREDMRDHLGWMEWTETVGTGHTMQARAMWEALSQHDRDVWIDRAVAAMAESCEDYDADNPDPPSGGPDGGGHPLERIA